jgi:hypothetical protein
MLALLQSMPPKGPASAYGQWGWRTPFLIGALITNPLFVHYRRAVEEPPTARTGPMARSPLVELISGAHRRQLLQVFVLMSWIWLVKTMVSAVLPGSAHRDGHLRGDAGGGLALVLAFPLCGALSQRVGPRSFYIGFDLLVAVAGSATYLDPRRGDDHPNRVRVGTFSRADPAMVWRRPMDSEWTACLVTVNPCQPFATTTSSCSPRACAATACARSVADCGICLAWCGSKLMQQPVRY